jgi:hypothetical protein
LDLKGSCGGWIRLHNEELHNLYTSANISRVIRRWAGHVVRMTETTNAYKFWSENMKGRDHLEELGVNGRIKLERILKNRVGS